MKKLIFLLSLFVSTMATSQIVIAPFEIQVAIEINQLEKVIAPVASSSCGTVQVIYKDELFSGGCLGTIVRTYYFKDSCGNTADCQQFISQRDDVPPVFVNPPKDQVISDLQNLPPASDIKVSDNSDQEVTQTVVDEAGKGVVIRIWVAEDRCGNQTEYRQTFRIK
jgi:hypothetical protein